MLMEIIGIFVGVLSRLMLPYFRKIYYGEDLKFNKMYLIKGFISLLLSGIFCMLIIPEYNFINESSNLIDSLKIFATSFTFGFGWLSITNEGGKWMSNTKKEQE